MAKVLGGRQAVPLEAVVLAQAFRLEALLNVLERRAVIKKAEVVGESARLEEKSVSEGPLETPRAPRGAPRRAVPCHAGRR
jgi:hypothetical protein